MTYLKRRARVAKEVKKLREKNAKREQKLGVLPKNYSELEERVNVWIKMLDLCWGDLEELHNEIEEIFYNYELQELDKEKINGSDELADDAYEQIVEAMDEMERLYEEVLPNIERCVTLALKDSTIWSWGYRREEDMND